MQRSVYLCKHRLSKRLPRHLVSYQTNHHVTFRFSSSNSHGEGSASDDSILYKVETLSDSNRSIGTLTLNVPSSLNALTVPLGRAFQQRIQQICDETTTTTTPTSSNNNNIDCLIIKGHGKAFSAGGNLQWLQSLHNNSVHANVDAMLNFYHSILCLRKLPVPVIACLNGPAMGAGAGLALACDLRVGPENAQTLLGLHFTKLGIHTGMGASHFLYKQQGIPLAKLNEILLTGKILSSDECLQYGLCNALSETPYERTRELAMEIVQTSHPVAVRALIQTIRTQQDVGLEAVLRSEAYAQAVCYARMDWGEGLRAIADKRSPVFDPYHSK